MALNEFVDNELLFEGLTFEQREHLGELCKKDIKNGMYIDFLENVNIIRELESLKKEHKYNDTYLVYFNILNANQDYMKNKRQAIDVIKNYYIKYQLVNLNLTGKGVF